MTTVYIENYGCVANYDNGAIIAGMLDIQGYTIVKDLVDADVAIINSCAVKNKTVNKIFYSIDKIKENYKDKKLVITGCMAIAEKNKLEEYLENGVALVSTQNITQIPEAIEKILKGEQVVLLDKRKEILLGLPKIEFNNKIASIQLSQGCLSACRFCSTKLAKGNLVSYPKEKIIEEIKKYANNGYKRINLTSTDNACYGFDLGYNIVTLLQEAVNIEGEFLIRVGMGNPEHTIKYLNELVEVYKNNKIIKFLHLPVQSGSNKVLKEMRRNYTIETFKEIVKTFRKEIPEISISTDIIVGYPTETEQDFQETISLVRELKFEVANISKFASRTGTPASKLKQLPSQEIKQRGIELTKAFNENRITDNPIKLLLKSY